MSEKPLLYFLLSVLAVASCGPAPDSAGPETKDEVRQLLEFAAAEWNQAVQNAPTECDPNREASELCIDQFKIDVADVGLGWIRHRRLLEDFDDEKLAAFVRLYGDGWTDREQVCIEPLLNLMSRFGVEIEFRYYAKDMRSLFQHKVGSAECEELFELSRQ